jgi:hypothetical protein
MLHLEFESAHPDFVQLQAVNDLDRQTADGLPVHFTAKADSLLQGTGFLKKLRRAI